MFLDHYVYNEKKISVTFLEIRSPPQLEGVKRSNTDKIIYIYLYFLFKITLTILRA